MTYTTTLQRIQLRCAEFLSHPPTPLYKHLPGAPYEEVDRVKVRHGRATPYDVILSRVFGDPKLHERVIECTTQFPEDIDDHWYYMFPTLGAQYVWSDKVERLIDYLSLVNESLTDTPIDQWAHLETRIRFNVIQNTPTPPPLGCDVLVYGIPDFYVVRVSSCPNYEDLLGLIASTAEPIYTEVPAVSRVV